MWEYFVLAGVTVTGALFAALYHFQGNLLYFPTVPQGSKTTFMDPKKFGLATRHQEVMLDTIDNLKIQVWFFKVSSAAATMLYFHGNAGNISHRLYRISQFQKYMNVNVCIVGYRGYGKSEGIPTQKGLLTDAQTALDYLYSRNDIDHNKIFVYGESLGGAVAAHLAAQNPGRLQAVILENTFTSVTNMISIVFPVLKYFAPLCTNKWETETIIPKITCPILFISGEKDELIPPAHMDRLFDLAASVKVMKKFTHGTHNETWNTRNYYPWFADFLLQVKLIDEVSAVVEAERRK